MTSIQKSSHNVMAVNKFKEIHTTQGGSPTFLYCKKENNFKLF